MSGMPGKFQMGTEMILFEGQKQESRIYNPAVNTTVHRTSTLLVSSALSPALVLMWSSGFSASGF